MTKKLENNEELVEKFLELYNQGKKDSEISRILGNSATSIGVLRNRLNLPPNGRIVVSDENFLAAFNKGLTLSEIARETGMSAAAATRRVQKLGIDYKKSENIKLNCIEIPKEDFLELYNQRNTDAEIARKYNCSESKIKRIRDSLDLPMVDRKHFTNEEFVEKYNLGKTDKELSIIFGTSEGYITQRRNKLNLAFNKAEIVKIPFTDTEFQVILGTVLGDTYLGRKNDEYDRDIYGSCAHCLEQEELIFTKYNYLKNLSSPPFLSDMHDDRFKIPDYQRWNIYIKTNPSLTEIYPLFYNNKIKYVNKDLLYKIEGLGLAIWYMDDGSNCKYGYKLCTNGFNLDDLNVIKEVFHNKFNIETNFHKDGSIYIPAKSKQTFKKLVEPYIINSMLYKL